MGTFSYFENGMGDLSSYSQIYTRFLFSNLVKEFFTHQHQDRKKLETAVQKVYEMQSVQEVISLVETLIQNMEERLAANNDGARNEVAQAKSYIYEHYSEDISVEKLSDWCICHRDISVIYLRKKPEIRSAVLFGITGWSRQKNCFPIHL